MSTPSWKRKDNTYCKYCQQWIRDTPSEKRNHERSKHHVINVQKHINNQQISERNKQKEEQRNRKIVDNIERKVQSGSNGENQYYQAFLKHQQEMDKLPSVVMENVFNSFTNQQQADDTPHPPKEPQQDDVIQEPEQSDSFECNDLPLGAIVKSIKPVETHVAPKTSAPKKKTYTEPTEIGSYYDDPNFFYYEQEEEKEEKEKVEEQPIEEVIRKEKPKSDWKNQYSNATTASANTFGQWEIVQVSKIEADAPSESNSSASSTKTHQNKDEHEEDQFGGSYNIPETKKRKNETIEESSKKVKSEDNAPRKPLSFSLAKKK
ncbi:predicted protein [Naegleria gruberi]|uniref:Predicted protein n=1 Tax=Naegleria gruberi TaxID=5762 RepID=D2VFP8_NAEGR|nr:uncharacterized protein NAEGRDRAFT_49162 [Naegleria gruberi]EFC44395.1 predicted protein [Naegleria gruberi]|eukprot:XP_002677139.1 predicted protein [Naegleria gruberi strain NEG-M]